MGSKHFTVPCILSYNGYGINSNTLVDTGANGFSFIDTSFAIDAMKFLNIKPQPLVRPIPIKGYDGKHKSSASHFLVVHLTVDGRRQENIPFIILDLGQHDVILGLKWMAHFDIWLNVREQKLIWPEPKGQEPTSLFEKEIYVPRDNIRPKPVQEHYQEDLRARDRAFDLEDKRREAGKRSIPPSPEIRTFGVTYEQDVRTRTQVMNRELALLQTPMPRTKATLLQQELPSIDIAEVGSAGFYFNMQRPENEVFALSLYELDRMIEDRETLDTPENEDLLDTKLPEYLQNHRDSFSESASNQLPPHRPYDHKIHLEGEAPLGYSPLYNQSTEELKAIKQYLVDNLHKGFIEPSQAPFASPTLFVKKPNGGLRFCIDFRRLNALTKKDRYPLPLIDETLARISQAKIFTKLDIR